MVLSDEDIKRLYQDPKFLGSFSGAVNLRSFLYTDYGEVRQLHYNYNLGLIKGVKTMLFYSMCHFQDSIAY